jgi:NAD(P)H-hydrate repair Nnr-like enzyme with NAD(P)H-hydrate epimerase domain
MAERLGMCVHRGSAVQFERRSNVGRMGDATSDKAELWKANPRSIAIAIAIAELKTNSTAATIDCLFGLGLRATSAYPAMLRLCRM